jgi:hypothetical protein
VLLPLLTIGGQNKDVKKMTDKKAKKDKQRSRDAVKSEKGRRSVSSSAEAEVEGADEVLEWRCM